jgi:hypothetical protein
MITNTIQKWEPGERVKVGFLTLTVLENIGSQHSGDPETYRLVNPKTTKTYRFTPYLGLQREWGGVA